MAPLRALRTLAVTLQIGRLRTSSGPRRIAYKGCEEFSHCTDGRSGRTSGFDPERRESRLPSRVSAIVHFLDADLEPVQIFRNTGLTVAQSFALEKRCDHRRNGRTTRLLRMEVPLLPVRPNRKAVLVKLPIGKCKLVGMPYALCEMPSVTSTESDGSLHHRQV